MEPLVLTDPSKFPTEEYIFSIIGKNSEHWKELMNSIDGKFPSSTGEWRFYKDGGNWLFKMVFKKKTLFWIGIQTGTFRITFYFGDKAETSIIDSMISETLKEQFITGKRYGKIRAITIVVNEPSDINNAVRLADIKSKF